MPDYRRFYVPGGTFFLTIATYQRSPIFGEPRNTDRLRHVLRLVKHEAPFEILAAVILPDHVHFLWSLPCADSSYSRRIGRMKALFTQSLHGRHSLPQDVSISRRKHRESDVWQRRFWEHTILDDADFENHLDYIHYNPVKHGLTACPHSWPSSSFHRWVRNGLYDAHWGCQCDGRIPQISAIARPRTTSGE